MIGRSLMRFPLALLAFVIAGNTGLGMAADAPLTLAVDAARGRLEARFQERPLLVYVFATNQFKPYVRELYSLNGVNLLRDAPADHLHHHGLMFALRVNGVNFWEENDQPGVQKAVRLLSHGTGRDSEGRPRATFTHLLHWVTGGHRWEPETEAVALLVERRTLTLVVDETAGEVALRWQAAFEAGRGAGTIKWHGSIYNGLGLRLPKAFDLAAVHENSAGTVFAKPQRGEVAAAQWSAISAAVEGKHPLVVLFGRAGNPGDTRFFTMLDPFAYLSVTQNLAEHPREYAPGDRVELDYLLCVYSERKSAAFLNERQRRWENE